MLTSTLIKRRLTLKPLINFYKCECSQRNIQNVGMDIPKITVTDIRKVLRQKGFAVQEGFTSISTKCSICSGDQKPADSKVYVNKTTGIMFFLNLF